MIDFFFRMTCDESAENETQSIVHHVKVLLNSRQGCLVHMPDYGLPDYGNCPDHRSAKHYFIDSIEQLIKRYEPRIKTVSIQEVSTDHLDCILHLAFTAELRMQKTLRFNTILLSGGEFRVLPGFK